MVEILSERTGRRVTIADAGLSASESIDSALGLDYAGTPSAAVDVVTRLWVADLDEARAVLTATVNASTWSDAALNWLVRGNNRGSEAQPVTKVGATDIAAVRATVDMFARLDNDFGGGHARRALIEFLRTDVAPMLHGTYSDPTGRSLYAAAAEGTLLAAWMTYDAGKHGLAQRYFIQALRLAQAAEATMLAASILDAMSHQATFLGQSYEAVNLARAASSGSRDSATPSLKAHFLAMEARALGVGGDSVSAERALLECGRLFECRHPGSDPDWFTYFDDAELSAEFSHCFRDLGRYRDAVVHAERALSGASPRSDFFVTMVRAVGLLGGPGSTSGDLDAACDAALAALELGVNLRSARCHEYMRDFRVRIEPHASATAVRQLADVASGTAMWQASDPDL